MPKKEKPVIEEVEEIAVPDETLDVLAVPGDLAIVEPEAGPAAAKRSIGPKEPIPFKWKILGAADRFILTLFKSVEREDADAQLERLNKEGYYTELRVVDINEKIEQPVQKEVKKAKPAKVEIAAKPAKTERPTRPQKPVAKEEKTARVTRTERTVAKTASGAKSAAKTAEKTSIRMTKPLRKKIAAAKPAKSSSKRR